MNICERTAGTSAKEALIEALYSVGCPRGSVLAEVMVADAKGHTVRPDIVVADVHSGNPIAVFEIKKKKCSSQDAFSMARRSMAYFLEQCPCYVVYASDEGMFKVASVFKKEAELPTWVSLADKEAFKALFGDYLRAKEYCKAKEDRVIRLQKSKKYNPLNWLCS